MGVWGARRGCMYGDVVVAAAVALIFTRDSRGAGFLLVQVVARAARTLPLCNNSTETPYFAGGNLKCDHARTGKFRLTSIYCSLLNGTF